MEHDCKQRRLNFLMFNRVRLDLQTSVLSSLASLAGEISMRRKIMALTCLGVVLSGCATFPTEQPPARGEPPPGAFVRPPGAKVILVVLENKNEQPARERPFLARLAREGRYLANYHAVAHPSQPNYIAMVSGSIEGVDRGDTNVTLNRCHLGKNLASWTVYAEGYPGGQDACYWRWCTISNY